MDTIKDFMDKARGNRKYYYIWAIINGKLFIDGAYATPDEAYATGYEKVKHYFEVEQLPTKNIDSATRMIKHKRLEATSDLEESMQRAKHKI